MRLTPLSGHMHPGANQAVAMARLGSAVSMAGRVGSDPFGERYLYEARFADFCMRAKGYELTQVEK